MLQRNTQYDFDMPIKYNIQYGTLITLNTELMKMRFMLHLLLLEISG